MVNGADHILIPTMGKPRSCPLSPPERPDTGPLGIKFPISHHADLLTLTAVAA